MIFYCIISNKRRSETVKSIIKTIIKTRQNGLCYSCRLKIEDLDILVSHGGKVRHYYHKECAERVHIL
jgi:hypothetical protein